MLTVLWSIVRFVSEKKCTMSHKLLGETPTPHTVTKCSPEHLVFLKTPELLEAAPESSEVVKLHALVRERLIKAKRRIPPPKILLNSQKIRRGRKSSHNTKINPE